MLLALAMLACGVPEEPACKAWDWFPDEDGDTYGDASGRMSVCGVPEGAWLMRAGDCDDRRADVRPGGTETCDGADQDCDGEVDEHVADAPTWFADADGDGWGDPRETTEACHAPEGYVSDDTDCDDAAPDSHPAGVEACGGRDEDCDGLSDEDDAWDVGTWYRDGDGDGWGDASAVLEGCDPPAGYAATPGDCDDARAEVNPAGVEICGGLDEDCDGEQDEADASDAPTWYPDADGDGFGDPDYPIVRCFPPYLRNMTDDASDCDDTDAWVNPLGDETCGGGDEDCDGAYDEPVAVGSDRFFLDNDGDGYGDDASPVYACTQPAGTSTYGRDCDDADAAYNPSATEACGDPDYDCDGLDPDDDQDGDGTADCDDCRPTDASIHPGATEDCGTSRDDDCDGSTNAEDALSCEAWYADADADGYGDATDARCLCDADGAWSSQRATDCDDADRWVNPGVAEDCATAVDDDCDGESQEADADGCTDWYADADADGYGEGDATCLCTQEDAATVATGGDCDGADDAVNPGEAEVCADGVDQDCDGHAGECGIEGDLSVDDATVSFSTTSSSDYFGTALAGLGDLDGDGYDDLAIGAPYADGAGSNAGAAYVLYGPRSGETAAADADATLEGATGEYTGSAIAIAGDTDGDGVTELIVGGSGMNGTAGGAWLLEGAPTGSVAMSTALATLQGLAAYDFAGYAVDGVGDTDGDGLDDVLVAAPYESTVGGDAGAVYLVLGPVVGTISLAAADSTVYAAAAGDNLGLSVTGAGDLDGDGFADVALGASANDAGGGSAGAAYVFSGPLTAGSLSASAADAEILGSSGDLLGFRLADAGDADGDGYDDLLVTLPYEGAGSSRLGSVTLFSGPLVGSVVPADATAVLHGDRVHDYAGYAVDAGDLDGDGHVDIVVGFNSNYVVVAYGPHAASAQLADAAALLDGGEDHSDIGRYATLVGDTDGDGYPDLLVGASLDNEAWLFPGGPGM